MVSEARHLQYLDTQLDEVRRPSRPSLRAVADPTSESATAFLTDVADLPARLISGLPAPVTLRLRAFDGSAFHVSGSPSARAALRETGAIVLDGPEWDLLVLATEADRAWPADLVRSLRARGVGGRLDPEVLLDGITAEQASRDAGRLFSTARVLARLGARLDAVVLDEDGPEARAQ